MSSSRNRDRHNICTNCGGANAQLDKPHVYDVCVQDEELMVHYSMAEDNEKHACLFSKLGSDSDSNGGYIKLSGRQICRWRVGYVPRKLNIAPPREPSLCGISLPPVVAHLNALNQMAQVCRG